MIERAMIAPRSIVAAKLETTPGTAVALSAADAAMIFEVPKFKSNSKGAERPSPTTLGHATPSIGQLTGTITGFVLLAGIGTDGGTSLVESVLLPACGMPNVASTNTVTSTPTAAATIGLYQDGWVRKLAGACGKVKFTFSAGNPVRCDFEFLGKRLTPATATLLTPTLPSAIPPTLSSATISFGSATYLITDLIIIIENELVVLQADDSTSEKTGCLCVVIASRRVTVEFSPEKATTKDFAADFIASTTAAMSIVVGSVANNIITFTLPALAHIEEPETDDKGGIIGDRLMMLATDSGSDNAFSINWS